MDAFVNNLQQIKGFKYIIFGAKAFIENFVETGNPSKVDIGPSSVDGRYASVYQPRRIEYDVLLGTCGVD